MKFVVLLLSFIASVWVFFDARQRGKSFIASFIWCMGTQLTSGLLLLVWLFKRPAINLVYIMREKY
jgi:uncharacterized membrane protein